MVSQPPGQLVAHVEEPAWLLSEQALQFLGGRVHCDNTRPRRWRWQIGTGRALWRRCAVLCGRTNRRAPLLLDRAGALGERGVFRARRLPARLGLALDGPARLDDRPHRRASCRSTGGPTSASHTCGGSLHVAVAPACLALPIHAEAPPIEPNRDVIVRTAARRRLVRNPIAPPRRQPVAIERGSRRAVILHQPHIWIRPRWRRI